MATQKAATASRTGGHCRREAPHSSHRNRPRRADRRRAADPQAREHQRSAGRPRPHLRFPPRRCPSNGCFSRPTPRAISPVSPTPWMPASRSATKSFPWRSSSRRADSPTREPARSTLLDERSRGKVAVGDLSILFQFVTPPPPQPRPQLPASVRGSCFTGMDWALPVIARRVLRGPPGVRHVPAQRGLAAQAGHRGDPRSLRPDGGQGQAARAAQETGDQGRKEDEDKKAEKKGSASSANKRPRRKSRPRKRRARRRTARAAGRTGAQHRHPEAARAPRPTGLGPSPTFLERATWTVTRKRHSRAWVVLPWPPAMRRCAA